MDIITRWIDRSATLRITALDATRACRTICLIHGLDGEPARALSQAICGGLLMASDLKSMQTFSLQLDWGAWTSHVDATLEGLVRGLLVKRSHESTSARVQGRRFGQKGLVYQSIVDVAATDPAGALEGFLLQSDQQPTLVDLQVDLDREGLPSSARGAWLHGFPDTKPEHLAQFLSSWRSRGEGWNAVSPWMGLVVGPWDALGSKEPQAFCPCSEEKAMGALVALGRKTLEEAHEEGRDLEIICDFCHSRYAFQAGTLLSLLDGAAQA